MTFITTLTRLARTRRLRQWAGVAITIITIGVIWAYFGAHPQYLTSITHISVPVVLAILALNAGVIIALVFVYTYTLRLCGYSLPLGEQFLLTAYSSLTNFFGPLQSGPGVRAVYLRTKVGVPIRRYVLATLINYAMFAGLSVMMLVGGARPWWQAVVALIITGAISYVGTNWYIRRNSEKALRLQPSASTLLWLLVATFAQICCVAGYYFIELRIIDPGISLYQAISYTGAANLALFVSITPDAIGIREGFLVMSQGLHHIPTATILAANLIDRAVYALFLVLLFGVVIALHAKRRLQLK